MDSKSKYSSGADDAEYGKNSSESEFKGIIIPQRKLPKFFRPVVFVIVLCFCIFAAADVIKQQNEIEQLEQETVMLASQIEEAAQLYDEYEAMLAADEEEFMERAAVEKLGYSYPNERRYYIVNND